LNRFQNSWVNALVRNRPYAKLAHLAPAVIIYQFSHIFPSIREFVHNITFAYMLATLVFVVEDIIDILYEIFSTTESAKNLPVKGYVQTVKILLFVFGAILVLSVLVNRSPWYFISGLGALTAVLLLVFRDTLLSLFASFQIISDDMVRVGDWVEMPKFDADGDVIDIALHTVKVQNWDKTITTIPTYKFVTESFRNWRGMSESGGRRICRSINIDINSVRFCDEDLLQKMEKLLIMREHLSVLRKDIAEHNSRLPEGADFPGNGRALTNIGQFRAYILLYLQNHSGIHKGMTLLVRQTAPGEHGIPMQIYAFTNTVVWVEYERIQSDIFDHLFAVLPVFGLRAFQDPSGTDFQNLVK
jgi:miniconductance mechanosensitive channel